MEVLLDCIFEILIEILFYGLGRVVYSHNI